MCSACTVLPSAEQKRELQQDDVMLVNLTVECVVWRQKAKTSSDKNKYQTNTLQTTEILSFSIFDAQRYWGSSWAVSGQLRERPTDLLSDPNTRRKPSRGYRHETGEGTATEAFMYPASLAPADSDLVYMISRTTGAWLAPLHYYPVPSFLSSLIHQSKPASLQLPL